MVPTHFSVRAATLLAVTLVAADSSGQDQPRPAPGCDYRQIRWFVPGKFERARAKAKSNQRLLIIKGISFGVDDAGAKCATKGKW